MSLRFFLISLVLFVAFQAIGKDKKIKLKGNKALSYTIDKDSSCLSIKEVKKLMPVFSTFYNAIHADDFDSFSAVFSDTSKQILGDKLERKFNKLKEYKVHLEGCLKIISIEKVEGFRKSKLPIYSVIVKLPEGQEIYKRTGFDPVKRAKNLDEPEKYVGMTFTQNAAGAFNAFLMH